MLKQSEIDQVQQLTCSAAALGNVLGADEAIRNILTQINRIVSPKAANGGGGDPGTNETPKALTNLQRIEQCLGDQLKLFGMLKELSQNPETPIGELRVVAIALGYRGVAVGLV